jgi:CRP/FNR family transcriptional regulator
VYFCAQRKYWILLDILIYELNDYTMRTFSPDDENNKKLVDFLKKLGLSASEIKTVTNTEIEFKKGENVCKQGSFASYIMILKEGWLKSFVENIHFKSTVFKITKPFSIIGLSCLYGDNHYHFGCQAITPSKVCLVERVVFDDIIRTNNKFASEIIRMYSNSLQNLYDRLNSISNKQSLSKVCDSLIYLSEKIFESNVIPIIITRRDIAELSGLATENIVRILAELKSANAIAVNKKEITILDMDMLKRFSCFG